MSLFVDKYRPKTLDDLHYHDDLSKRIRTLVSRPSAAEKQASQPRTRRRLPMAILGMDGCTAIAS